MNTQIKDIIKYGTLVIVGLYMLVLFLVKAKMFLIPLSIAVLLIFMVLPINNKLMEWGIGKGLAVLVSIIVLLAVCAGFLLIIVQQVNEFSENAAAYENQLTPKIERAQNFLTHRAGISSKKQAEIFNNLKDKTYSYSQKWIKNIVSFIANFVLVFVYIFFFLFYKTKFKNAILAFIPASKQKKTTRIISNASKVGTQYLFGRFLLILFLAVIYSVGLGIIGIKQFLFVGIIAALFSLIPYFGNVIGFIMAVLMSLVTSGEALQLLYILILFTITQLIENYILEPYVVGHKVNINPAVTIIGVIIGGLIWGVAGTIVAIPFMGMLKVVFENVSELRPLGYVLNEKDLD